MINIFILIVDTIILRIYIYIILVSNDYIQHLLSNTLSQNHFTFWDLIYEIFIKFFKIYSKRSTLRYPKQSEMTE